MAQHPFLKSIHPVNLLSFGPDTKEIELRPLNILIGPNGSGKSNLIEIVGLLQSFTEKKPWTHVTETGGVNEWAWKDAKNHHAPSSQEISLETVVHTFHIPPGGHAKWGDFSHRIKLEVRPWSSTFLVSEESVCSYPMLPDDRKSEAEIWRDKGGIVVRNRKGDDSSNSVSKMESLDQVSVLSAVPGPEGALPWMARGFSQIKLYREWIFGFKSTPRSLEQAGRETTYLEENNSNLAHVLNFILTHQNPEHGQKLREAFRKFSADAEDIEIRLQEGFVQLRIRESSGMSVPATRLSDGALRWLALLAILLNPAPPSVICIEEPELGLHPDMIPTLAELLRDASERTQLIVTTHSQSLVECFSDDPETVCVCEKEDGATQIRRLEDERLQVWLKDYSLGQLWASGQIGGNRW